MLQMPNSLPTERTAKRAVLMQRVAEIRDILAAGAAESEANRTLCSTSVQALREAGMFALKVPYELGGAEADPVTQIDVFEAISYIDPSAGWAAFIGCGSTSLTAYLPQPAIDRMWSQGRIPTAAALVMPGSAKRVPGGCRVNGRWSWGSGIRHAEWVGVHVLIDNNEGPPASRFVMLPINEIEIHDNWHVSGLKGTGSCDFTIHDKFVSDDFSFDLRGLRPQRGGPMYKIGLPGLVANELGAFGIGVARRALDEVTQHALSKRRGYGKKTTVADRQVFQRFLGEADYRLRAARHLLVDINETAWQTVCRGESPNVVQQIEMRSAAAFAVHAAYDIAQQAFRYAGGSAIFLDNILQRCVRDLQVGSVHLFSSDAIYEQRGKHLLGMTDLNAMI